MNTQLKFEAHVLPGNLILGPCQGHILALSVIFLSILLCIFQNFFKQLKIFFKWSFRTKKSQNISPYFLDIWTIWDYVLTIKRSYFANYCYTRNHCPCGASILALAEGFWGPSAHLTGLCPLFWGPVALISSWITLMISYSDCPAWVHAFRHQKLYDWSIFGHNSSDCVKV